MLETENRSGVRYWWLGNGQTMTRAQWRAWHSNRVPLAYDDDGQPVAQSFDEWFARAVTGGSMVPTGT